MKDKFKEVDKKKFIIIIGGLLLLVVIALGGALVYNKFFSKSSYDEVLNNMKMAAIQYYEDRGNKLPASENSSVTVSDTELVNTGLMKSVNDQLKTRGYTCDGEVIVTNINGNYRYNPILDCGDEYQTITLNDYIDENVSIVKEGNGLYKLDDALVYRGDNVNNYVKLAGKVYRIVKIVDDHIVIILTDKADSVNWDNRYNIDKNNNVGINDYTVSRMREHLENLYKENSLLTDKAKLLVTNYDLQIGTRTSNDTDKTGALENAVVLENQYIGLLPVYDFLNASIDENCTSTSSKSCVNYNYLAKYKNSWWTTTAVEGNTYSVFKISNGTVTIGNASSNAYLRPVLYLASDAIYVSGDGSNSSPFIIK